MPYIKQEKLKQNAKDLSEKYQFKKNQLTNHLKEEKDRVSGHIHTLVKSFFHEELINQLYDKIDPHPDYKNIEFKCDFSGASPKLNVLVSKKGDEISSSPALYFSTAQLNVLSLSNCKYISASSVHDGLIV